MKKIKIYPDDFGIWFIADTHFGHANIIKYCNRPFKSVWEMDDAMINRWNSVVDSNDIVFHLGDFALCAPGYAKSILEKLNGKIYLAVGSHEKTVLRGKLYKYFEDIQESYYIEVGEQDIFVSHCCHKVWHKSHRGTWHCFAHSHGGLDQYSETEGKLLDVGVDTHNFYPVSYENIEVIMESRPLNFNDLERKRY